MMIIILLLIIMMMIVINNDTSKDSDTMGTSSIRPMLCRRADQIMQVMFTAILIIMFLPYVQYK